MKPYRQRTPNDPELAKLSVRLPRNVHIALTMIAMQRRQSMNAVLISLLHHAINSTCKEDELARKAVEIGLARERLRSEAEASCGGTK